MRFKVRQNTDKRRIYVCSWLRMGKIGSIIVIAVGDIGSSDNGTSEHIRVWICAVKVGRSAFTLDLLRVLGNGRQCRAPMVYLLRVLASVSDHVRHFQRVVS